MCTGWHCWKMDFISTNPPIFGSIWGDSDYCWWKNSCTLAVENPINNGTNYRYLNRWSLAGFLKHQRRIKTELRWMCFNQPYITVAILRAARNTWERTDSQLNHSPVCNQKFPIIHQHLPRCNAATLKWWCSVKGWRRDVNYKMIWDWKHQKKLENKGRYHR